MSIKISLGGATGWVGRSLAHAINNSDDLKLVSAIGKTNAGKSLGEIIGISDMPLRISKNIRDAILAKPDVYIDFTHPSAVKKHVVNMVRAGIPVVIGTSGLTEKDYHQINQLSLKHKVGVLAAGNFAISAVLLNRFATTAAEYIPHWEILDYAPAEKPDAPSGTARELAAKLAEVRSPAIHYPIERTLGLKESRGGSVKGSQIHSIRLPGYVFAFEIIFGQSNEKLILYHEAGNGAEPYVAGTLLAARSVRSFIGLRRGLDTIMKL